MKDSVDEIQKEYDVTKAKRGPWSRLEKVLRRVIRQELHSDLVDLFRSSSMMTGKMPIFRMPP